MKQEHPRGSIVEPQDLHQDGLNSLSPIIIAHVMTFSNAKEKKMKLSQVGVGSNIAKNHSSRIQGVISGHYLAKFT